MRHIWARINSQTFLRQSVGIHHLVGGFAQDIDALKEDAPKSDPFQVNVVSLQQ